MTTILIVLIIIAVSVNIIMAVYFLRKNKANKPQDETVGLKMLLEQMNTNMNQLSSTVDRKVGDLAKTVDGKINESSKSVQESMRAQLSESSKLIREVTQGLTKLNETNKQVVSFADQLQNLQDI